MTATESLRARVSFAAAFLLALEIAPLDVTNTFLDGGTGSTPAGSSVLLSNPQRVLRNVADDAIID